MRIAALKLLIGNFQAIFDGTLTANRSYNLPDKNGMLALLSDIQTLGDRPVTWNSTKPSSPVNGQLWFEPLGYDIPWEWNSGLGLWLSPVRNLILPISTVMISSQSTNRCDHPLVFPDSTYGIYIRNVTRHGIPASALSTTNYWSIVFGWGNQSNNSLNQLNTFNTTGYTTANNLYRNSTTVNTNYNNPFSVYSTMTKVGTPGAISMNLVVDYRVSRT